MILGAAVVALGVVALLFAEFSRRPHIRTVAKPLASAGFLLAAVRAPAFQLPDGMGWVLLAALVLAALGDVLLIPNGHASLFGGIGAFAVAQILYGAWFLAARPPALVLAVSVGVFLVLGHLAWLRVSPHVTGGLRLPVRLYVLVVAMMAATAVAFGVHAAPQGAAAAMPAVGGLLLFGSDVAVARQRFIVDSPANRAWGLPTYYAAQLLLAYAVLG